MKVRPIRQADFEQWKPLWAGSMLSTVARLRPRSTTRSRRRPAEHARGRGVGRALIEGVYEKAQVAGISRVYWQTQSSNAARRALYDKVAKHSGFIVYSYEPAV